MSDKPLKFAIFLSLVLSLIAFWDHQVTSYLKEFVVLIHEICHATAALFTGGVVKGIALHGNEGGETIATPASFRGSFILVVSAGYVGCSLVGGLLLRAGFSGRHARQTLILFGLFLISVSVLYSKLGELAYFTGILWGVGILVVGMLGESISILSLVFLGTSISLYSIYDLSDFADKLSDSDAGILAFWMAGLSPEDLSSEDVPKAVLFLGYLIASLWSLLSIGIIIHFLRSSLHEHTIEVTEDNAKLADWERFPGDLSPEAKVWLEKRGVDPESGIVIPPDTFFGMPPKDN
ncbi:peptidase M50B-like protein [Leptospira ryugenii]|uniref:Peptidase M50B-like protein n=1 Tax=Leptospira ryugenii TaxID=1917863 RepID=A0A2P2E3S9_9LEPT|nr:M50 family metallopeptidase [Leptospira ryugenii]GBF51545.1 peptidase M50B-like protein [Leptospira ryugenii]